MSDNEENGKPTSGVDEGAGQGAPLETEGTHEDPAVGGDSEGTDAE